MSSKSSHFVSSGNLTSKLFVVVKVLKPLNYDLIVTRCQKYVCKKYTVCIAFL